MQPGNAANTSYASATAKPLQRATLEMSLKPFKSLTPEAIDGVCREALRQWLPLLDMAQGASILLWASDGSEILTWNGKEETEFEWARYIGFANEDYFSHIEDKSDPRIARPYSDNPVPMTYGDLKRIVASFKRIAANQYGIALEVGATFDAGPEFAYSDFKYKLHPEINRAELGGKFISLKADYTVVCTWSKLQADQTSYAAYPNGIPQDTPFGEFLGRQSASFLDSLGFDYIWFSNGFALSYFPWTYLGANFDGTTLPLADYRELSDKVMSFWDLFKKECPHFRTEIRGTNFGTGMDLAKDFVPMRSLYENKYIELPPPNSPWGALNFDFGLEMAGYMSRIAELPGTTYPYRFYANDPWFWQNPWWDLYDREPHDIYLPLSIARINADGRLESPGVVEILTIDTELGDLNANGPAEIVPHIRKAYQDAPDQPGLLTWLYPFSELHDAVEASNARAGEAFFHDWFVRNAINHGLPLNTVIGTDTFFSMHNEARSRLADTILLAATSWLQGEKAAAICEYVRAGGKILLYGPVEDQGVLDLLNLKKADALEGDCTMTVFLEQDCIAGYDGLRQIRHQSMIACGGISEQVESSSEPHTRVCARVNQGEQERAFALHRKLPEWNGGEVGWIRGSLPFKAAGITHLPERQDGEWDDSALLVRYMLQNFGYTLLQEKRNAGSQAALFFTARHRNGFMLNGCKQDTSVLLRLRFPEGIPLITGQSTIVGGGESSGLYTLDRTFHDEIRVFVEQEERSLVRCREMGPTPTKKKRAERTLSVSGLKQATLMIYPPLEAMAADLVEVKHNGLTFLDLSEACDGKRVRLTDVSGTIDISW